ncbi:MAG: hypothetical protein J0H11_08480 [Rhizobiales bacterium]|nr:hypothetical protein [Hyphomicrobiales bacterium]
MGREASVQAEIGGETGEVRALLESSELILRGAIKRRYPKSELRDVIVEGEALRFTSGGEVVRLHLGARVAESWAKAIATPPPSLGAKLGLDKGLAFLIGSFDDPDLAAALDGATVDDPANATLLIAPIDGPDDLAKAASFQAAHPHLALWAIYPKGRDVAFGDGAIRTALRGAGFRDTKSCAVSERLTATRYNRTTAED